MKITQIIIVPYDNTYHATIELSSGNRFFGVYAHAITKENVIEDFRENKSSFHHIN